MLAEQANLQLALDAVLGDAEILGFTARHMGFGSIGLSEILAGHGMTGPICLGPVQYADVEVGDGRVIQCVASGVFLAVRDEAPVALVLSRAGDHPMQPLVAEARGRLAGPRHGVGAAARAARGDARAQRVPRPDHLAAPKRPRERSACSFMRCHTVERDGVILPQGTLERLERHSIGVAERADWLRPPASTSSAACCCTGRRAPARRCR